MKVLFVCSGNAKTGISPIVKNQGESLKKVGCQIEYFAINSKGFWGYLSSIPKLRRHFLHRDFDLVHAHYSLSATVAYIAGVKPLIVSLMGSDVIEKNWFGWFVRHFLCLFWKNILVKSESMKQVLAINNVSVIPNGVDLSTFKPLDKEFSCNRIGWLNDKKHVLFAANPQRYEKNYEFAQKAVACLKRIDVELHHLDNVPSEIMQYYYNASDVVILTSLWEGSPNVIKEAMACRRPIVSTDVGDVRYVFGSTEGCYITTFIIEDLVNKIRLALDFSEKVGRTDGREQVLKIGLDSNTISGKLLRLYKEIIKANTKSDKVYN